MENKIHVPTILQGELFEKPITDKHAKESKELLWRQFSNLGEMMGDGLHNESGGKWIAKEYKKLSRALIPELREREKDLRKQKNKIIDEKMTTFLQTIKCDCGGDLQQVRSGSKTCYCTACKLRYQAGEKSKETIL